MTLRNLPLLLLASSALLLGASASAWAQTRPARDTYEAMGRWQLRVGDTIDEDAQFFYRRTPPELLVVSEQLGLRFLVKPGDKKVHLLAPEALLPVEGDDDALRVDEKLRGTPVAQATMAGPIMRLRLGGKDLAIESREPLVGELKIDEILEEMPEFRRRARLYPPNRGQVRLLTTIAEPVTLEVFFGTWCPHCERIIPKLAKVIDEADSSSLSARYHLLPRRFSEDPIARQYGVTAVPTVIVRRGEAEVARLEGGDLNRPEAALSRVLFGGSGG